jgi:hypothetical protein
MYEQYMFEQTRTLELSNFYCTTETKDQKGPLEMGQISSTREGGKDDALGILNLYCRTLGLNEMMT